MSIGFLKHELFEISENVCINLSILDKYSYDNVTTLLYSQNIISSFFSLSLLLLLPL